MWSLPSWSFYSRGKDRHQLIKQSDKYSKGCWEGKVHGFLRTCKNLEGRLWSSLWGQLLSLRMKSDHGARSRGKSGCKSCEMRGTPFVCEGWKKTSGIRADRAERSGSNVPALLTGARHALLWGWGKHRYAGWLCLHVQICVSALHVRSIRCFLTHTPPPRPKKILFAPLGLTLSHWKCVL